MDQFVGQIQIFGFNYAPKDWAFCNGATMAIRQNTALYSLLGTYYGGDGSTTFMLPNFAARTGCNQGGSGPVTPRSVGDMFGENSVTLLTAEMPVHSHPFTVYNQPDPAKCTAAPTNGSSLVLPQTIQSFAGAAPANAPFAPGMGRNEGGNQPHENRQPYLAMNFCIALNGVFPSFGDAVA